MSDFHFLRPLWFLALPLLLALLWLLWQRRLQSRSWQGICDPALLPHLLLGRSQRRAPWPLWLLLAGLLLAVIALAGPTWQRLPQPLLRQQSALVIVLDLSRSMAAGDLKPSRLLRARLKIEDLLRQRREGQTALVVFAGDAFAVTPLTEDHRTIAALLSSLDPEIMPVQGSEPARALELGAELIQRTGLNNGTLLLVTDEDRPERSEAAASKLREQGLQLAIIGVGTPQGAPIPLSTGGFFSDRQGTLIVPRLEEDGLRRLARVGGGSYRRISIDDSDFHALLADLDSHRLDRAKAETTRRGDRWQEAGIWLLWPLALLAAADFRRGWLTVFALFLLLPASAQALSWPELWQRPDQLAMKDFAAGNFKEAGERFSDPRWKASALYKGGDYDGALQSLPEAESADDWYNRGNTLAAAWQLAEALKAYDQALKLKPADDDAVTNRKLVEEALQQEQQQEQQKEKKGQEKKEGGQQGEQEKQDQQKKPGGQEEKRGQSSSDQPSAADQKKEQESGEKPEAKSDQQDGKQKPPEPGQKADADQTQSNVQPSAQPGQEKNAAAALDEKAPATAEELELQQWLQRIPDDPGGLLRRKFLYQYRQRGEQLETDRPW